MHFYFSKSVSRTCLFLGQFLKIAIKNAYLRFNLVFLTKILSIEAIFADNSESNDANNLFIFPIFECSPPTVPKI